MTERLYYADPYRVEFDARVQQTEQRDGRTVAVLDQTAFYPTSGGQPSDVGLLEGVRVRDVFDRADGSIGHELEGTLQAGQQVHGVIDWARRFDHMQQHTGQHLLSAAFDRLHGVRTVSFHLGGASSTIDLATETAPETMAAAEAEANRVVWEDRLVSIRFATPEEAAALPLRKDPTREGPLRLIEIDGFDLSACGGTHVARTGAVGVVAVTSTERFRRGTRVEFVCGGRALRAFQAMRDTIGRSLRLLSVGIDELPVAIERGQTELKDVKRAAHAFQEQLAAHEAAELAARGRPVGDAVVVVESLSGWDAGGLKTLAVGIAERSRHVVAVLSDASPALVAIARSKDLALDASAVLKVLTDRFGGRGGGKPDLAQGGGLSGSSAEILETARAALIAAVSSTRRHGDTEPN